MTKKLTAMVLALMLMLAAGVPALADSEIVVNGSATVQLEPDLVMILLGVSALEDEVIKAQNNINEAMNRVVAALTGEELAIAPEDIATAEYYISERFDYDYETDRRISVGYEATAMLSVCVRDINQAGAVIDAAMQAGANQLGGVEFRSSDQTAARDQALTLAVQDGMRKAGVIAKAAGVALPALPSSIEEQDVYSYSNANTMVMYDMAAAETSAAGTTLQAGMLSLTANVSITYKID